MKKSLYATLLAICAVGISAYAGNPQRAGGAGASELLINPWARSSGWADVNIAGTRGIESSYMNIAGLAHIDGTQISFSNTQWLVGSGISINSAALATRVGSSGVLALSVQAFDYGEWEITTENLPEGGAGTISPSTFVLGLGYSQKFTESIFGGVNIKVYNSAINNLSTTGVAVDAGVQYITGDERQWKFGIALKNVGPGFAFEGDGFALNLPVPQGGYTQSYESRSAKFELPTQLSMGAAYDLHVVPDYHRVTFAAAFISNSFEKDNYNFGVEYGFREWFAVRAGYRIFDNQADSRRTTALQGFTAGFSFEAPMTSSSAFVLDYAYRMTTTFGGIHTIGLGLDLN